MLSDTICETIEWYEAYEIYEKKTRFILFDSVFHFKYLSSNIPKLGNIYLNVKCIL